jgi:hypothetical protein
MDCFFLVGRLVGWSVGWLVGTGRQSSMVDQGTKRICMATAARRDGDGGQRASGCRCLLPVGGVGGREYLGRGVEEDEDEWRDHGSRRDRGGVVG